MMKSITDIEIYSPIDLLERRINGNHILIDVIVKISNHINNAWSIDYIPCIEDLSKTVLDNFEIIRQYFRFKGWELTLKSYSYITIEPILP